MTAPRRQLTLRDYSLLGAVYAHMPIHRTIGLQVDNAQQYITF